MSGDLAVVFIKRDQFPFICRTLAIERDAARREFLDTHTLVAVLTVIAKAPRTFADLLGHTL